MKIELEPVAVVQNDRKEPSDDYWGAVISEITLLPHIPAEALNGIEAFSHLEIIYYFDRVSSDTVVMHGHPRGNTSWPDVGIFAQRKKDRPNRIGLTVAELVERKGHRLFVKHLDAISGTPVLDIKPVMKEFMPAAAVRQPEWSVQLMKDYWKEKE